MSNTHLEPNSTAQLVKVSEVPFGISYNTETMDSILSHPERYQKSRE